MEDREGDKDRRAGNICLLFNYELEYYYLKVLNRPLLRDCRSIAALRY